MKVLFHNNQLDYRGTTVSVTDYAKYNQEILGNESIICYDARNWWTNFELHAKLEKQFKVIAHQGPEDLKRIIDQEKIDFTYFQRSGEIEFLPDNCKTGVHVVFQRYEPHGDTYAYISEWLSDVMALKNSSTPIPWVPLPVGLTVPTMNYREEWNIKPDQFIFGRHGGHNTFNIPFVQEHIFSLLNARDDFVFVFLGTDRWITHPNVRFLDPVHDVQTKTNIINTWDAMIHARIQGESFGVAIAEALSLNKPVLAWEHGEDLHHTEVLKNSGLLYSKETIWEQMNSIKELANKEDWTQRVKKFKPEVVMNKFNEIFLR